MRETFDLRAGRALRCSILAASLALFGFGALACQSPRVSDVELSSEPIAFIYYTHEAARRRAEAYAEAPRNGATGQFENRGVLDLNRFGDFLGTRLGSDEAEEFPGRIALLDPGSGKHEVLSAATRGAIPLDWSPDHRRLLFSQETSGGMQLFEFQRETGVVLRITRGPDLHPWGCYGPEGRVAMVVAELGRDASGRPTIASRIALLAPGGGVDFVSDGPYDRDPTCAPDGSAIAWVRTRPTGVDEIWVRSPVADGEARAITPGANPSFSPDGEWIVYNQARQKTRLWRIHRGGAGRHPIGEWSGTEELRPRVSPDGTVVVFESVLKDRFRLFVRRMDGTGNRLLFADGDGTHAVW